MPAVFAHGDCWANNLLFRYDPAGSPRESRLIDLAGVRCSSPALDILHFLYTGLPRDVRTARLDLLLRHYLHALADTVRRAAPAAGPGLPFTLDELREELRRRAAFGLWTGLWMLPAIFFSPDAPATAEDYFSEETQARVCAAMPDEFHRRLLDLVEEHAENGAL